MPSRPVQPITHEQLRQAVRDCATRLGWMVWSTYDSRRSPNGEPDIRAAHPKQRRRIWIELKTGSGRLTPSQREAIACLQDAGAEVYVWRETNWRNGDVERILRGGE